MIKQFSQEFKNKLWDIIAETENNSQVEIVVMIKPESETYKDIALWYGIALAFISFSFFMFAPFVFGDYLLYTGTIFAFVVGMGLTYFIKPVLNCLVPEKRKKRSVEIIARALFQKAGINNTNEKIGVLFYISLLEKICFILPDKGAFSSIPQAEWERTETSFNKIFSLQNPADALLTELKALIPMFNKYLPPVENDINELPDNIEVSL